MPASPMGESETGAVGAYRSPMTVRALQRLGMSRALLMPITYVVLAGKDRFALVGRRSHEPFATFPTADVGSLRVGEWVSNGYHRDMAVAILIEVEGSTGLCTLPIRPISDDGKRMLRWEESEIRSLAERLADASGVEFVGRPKRVHRSIPDWTLDV